MDELEPKVCFKRAVRILFKVYQFFGLVNFTYNRATNRVQGSGRRQFRFICTLGFCGLTSLLCTFCALFLLVAFYYCIGVTKINAEEFLLAVRLILLTMNAFIFTMSYHRCKDLIVETLNQIIVLHERVNRLTDGSLFYRRSFRKFIILRLLLFVGTWIHLDMKGGLLFNIMCWISLAHCNTLMELTFWTQIYGNLTLMCFYHKMNSLLSVLCATSSERRIKRRIREVISISYEIHRVKQKFNDGFNTLQVFLFFGFLSDITSLYNLLKLLVFVQLGRVHLPIWRICRVIIKTFFNKFSALQSLYILSHLSEELVRAERIFRRKLMTMLSTNEILRHDPEQQRQMELVLSHHSLRDINTRSFNLFVINRRFIFGFASELIVTYAIETFQQYFGEYYSATGERLKLLENSLPHG